MNKKEQSIILNHYKEMYYAHVIVEIDKSDTLREFRYLLKNLNLTKERYIIENEIISEKNKLSIIIKDFYSMIFEKLAQYNKFVNYDLKEINMYYEELQFEMKEEENKYFKKWIDYIVNNQK